MGVTFEELKPEYETLLKDCEVKESWVKVVDQGARRIIANKARYQAISKITNIPWQFIGAIHSLESNCNFYTHLHNGDSLRARTWQVPAGRPIAPPSNGVMYTWEESALDALRMKGLHLIKDWSPERICYELERYNGFGYQLYHSNVNSPYLWSGTNRYTRGKYIADGRWDSSHVSQQVGAVALLERIDLLEGTSLVRRKGITKYLRENSLKLRIINFFRVTIPGLAGALLAEDNLRFAGDTIDQLKSFASANWLPILAVSGFGVWFLLKWIEKRQVKDFKEGRYLPSGLPEQKELPEQVSPEHTVTSELQALGPAPTSIEQTPPATDTPKETPQ